ncbi:MAG: YkgJ family cysteine cluster protein [Myxococcaceae bacterium]
MDRKALTETKALLAKADALYKPFSCPASAECCQLKNTGRQPWLWPSEWALLMAFLKRERRVLPPKRADGACPFLIDNRCSVYEARPFGCRTYFCHRASGPQRQPLEQTGALLDRFASLHAGEGEPKPLLDWYEEAS